MLLFKINVDLLFTMIFKDLNFMFYVHIGGIYMKIKREADSNDIAECSYDVKPSTGMFLFYVYILF